MLHSGREAPATSPHTSTSGRPGATGPGRKQIGRPIEGEYHNRQAQPGGQCQAGPGTAAGAAPGRRRHQASWTSRSGERDQATATGAGHRTHQRCRALRQPAMQRHAQIATGEPVYRCTGGGSRRHRRYRRSAPRASASHTKRGEHAQRPSAASIETRRERSGISADCTAGSDAGATAEQRSNNRRDQIRCRARGEKPRASEADTHANLTPKT